MHVKIPPPLTTQHTNSLYPCVRAQLLKYIHRINQTLFPLRCCSCQRWLTGDLALCATCLQQLPWLLRGMRCRRCLAAISWLQEAPQQHPPTCPAALPNQLCADCQQRRRYFNQCLIAFRYQEQITHWLCSFKFRHQLLYGELLGRLLCHYLRQHNLQPYDALVAVPLHRKRLRQRGFNQALELAKVVARSYQLPLLKNACQRIIHTAPQSSLKLKQRLRNCHGAFTSNPQAVANKRILLVDDTLTSGSTLSAVSKSLLHSGALEVDVLAVART